MRSILFLAILSLVACKKSAPAGGTGPDNGGGGSGSGSGIGEGGGVPDEPVTLLSLESGDIACYVMVETAAGEELSLYGDFELCPGAPGDASSMIGTKVVLGHEVLSFYAESCQGDMDCTDSEKVDAVTSISPAP